MLLRNLYFFKLVDPSIMDTNGIKMLQSIRIAFDLLPPSVTMNKVTFVKETIEKSDLINAMRAQKCPVVHTIDLSSPNITESLHIMVATGFHSKKLSSTQTTPVGSANTTYVQCKNSYRNNQGSVSYIANILYFDVEFARLLFDDTTKEIMNIPFIYEGKAKGRVIVSKSFYISIQHNF